MLQCYDGNFHIVKAKTLFPLLRTIILVPSNNVQKRFPLWVCHVAKESQNIRNKTCLLRRDLSFRLASFISDAAVSSREEGRNHQ